MITNINFPRIVKQNAWLIKLRWIAIIGVFFAIFLSWIFSLTFYYPGLIAIFVSLVIHNIIAKYLLNIRITKEKYFGIQRALFYQINFDLILLTILIFFSGGIGNPFFLFYFFHIVIASIILPHKFKYLITGISILLVALLSFMSYNIPINNRLDLFNNLNVDLCHNLYYIFSVLVIFSVTSIILMYFTSTITSEIKKQEESLKQLNEQLKEANKELKAKDAIKDEYVFRVTHDIKGHLAVIITNLSVLVQKIAGALTEKQEKFVLISYKRANRLQEFVRDLLRISQLRMTNSVEPQIFSINESIRRTITICEENANLKHIKINTNLKNDIFVQANQFSIEEVLSNLTLNAIKYTPENGSVEISILSKNKNVIIKIIDTGIGIPENDLKFVFNEFFRAKNAMEYTTDGTGLGLSLVKQIIESNNGKIGVTSILGKGSTFYFSLPEG